jgi:hypothetical protein
MSVGFEKGWEKLTPLEGYAVILYPVIAEPPFETGSVQEMVADPDVIGDDTIVIFVGLPGGDNGVAVTVDGGDAPIEFD